MKIDIKRINDDYLMEAVSETGSKLLMDASVASGGQGEAMTPMQMLLAAIGGCSAIDMISILKKQRQNISDFKVHVDGDSVKHGEYSVYETIVLRFQLSGEIDADKAKRAADLSFNKYCSVSKALEFSSEISYSIEINGHKI